VRSKVRSHCPIGRSLIAHSRGHRRYGGGDGTAVGAGTVHLRVPTPGTRRFYANAGERVSRHGGDLGRRAGVRRRVRAPVPHHPVCVHRCSSVPACGLGVHPSRGASVSVGGGLCGLYRSSFIRLCAEPASWCSRRHAARCWLVSGGGGASERRTIIVTVWPSLWRSVHELCGGLLNKTGKSIEQHAIEEVRGGCACTPWADASNFCPIPAVVARRGQMHPISVPFPLLRRLRRRRATACRKGACSLCL